MGRKVARIALTSAVEGAGGDAAHWDGQLPLDALEPIGRAYRRNLSSEAFGELQALVSAYASEVRLERASGAQADVDDRLRMSAMGLYQFLLALGMAEGLSPIPARKPAKAKAAPSAEVDNVAAQARAVLSRKVVPKWKSALGEGPANGRGIDDFRKRAVALYSAIAVALERPLAADEAEGWNHLLGVPIMRSGRAIIPTTREGAAWERLIVSLTGWANGRGMPTGTRAADDGKGPTPFMSLVEEIQKQMPLGYRRSFGTHAALHEAIRVARGKK